MAGNKKFIITLQKYMIARSNMILCIYLIINPLIARSYSGHATDIRRCGSRGTTIAEDRKQYERHYAGLHRRYSDFLHIHSNESKYRIPIVKKKSFQISPRFLRSYSSRSNQMGLQVHCIRL